MTGLVRKTTLLTVACLVVAGAALAGQPNENNSTRPTNINLVGYNNPPDPAGTVVYIIRDGGGSVVQNATVELNFSLCTDVQISQNVAGAGMTIDCANKRVFGNTDGLGQIYVNVVGAGLPGPPRSLNACVGVRVNGDPWTNITCAVFNLDGVSNVGSGDLSVFQGDFVSPGTEGRSDFNGNGTIGSDDLSIFQAIFVNGASALNGAPFCP